MKINQFATVKNEFKTELRELINSHFVANESVLEKSPMVVLKSLLQRCYPEMPSVNGADFKIDQLMATENLTATQLLKNEHALTVTQFYNLALQLLKFEVGVDFNLSDPISALNEINLPQLTVADFTTQDLLHAWYLLLTTHTKNGQSFLDHLATKGYFAKLLQTTQLPKPFLFNGKAQAVFDTNNLIREVVYVESDQDTDHDGQLDLLKVEILRPEETETGLKVPTLYTASPYNQGTNDEAGEKLTHNVDVPLTEKPVISPTLTDLQASEAKPATLPAKRDVKGNASHAEQSFSRESSYTLNDYFLARGFAVVYAAGIGTMESDGFRTTGDPEETTSTVAVIEWLAGNRQAFTNKKDHIGIEAWWSGHHVAITGRSYLGTLAIAAATSGVEGLDTIISEAAISSWYDYYRENGLVIAPGGFQGEDADVLAEETFSREKQAADYLPIKPAWQAALSQMGQEQDRSTGNYNSFWDARNYRKQLASIKADILMVHGLNDWNVKPKNVWKMWQGLKDLPVTQKIILHQGQHIYINNFQSLDYTDMVNLWLCNKLLGVQNNADEILPDVLVQDNTKVETWNAYQDWGGSAAPIELNLSADKLTSDAAPSAISTFTDQLSEPNFTHYKSHYANWRHDLVSTDSTPMAANRLIFKTDPLTKEVVLGGGATVSLRVASSQSVGMLSFRLIDYGVAKRLSVSPQLLSRNALDEGYHWREDDLKEFQLASATPYKLISIGHLNLQNQKNSYQTEKLVPNQFVDVSIDLQPTVFRVQPGHQIGLVVYATDMEMTVRGNQDIQYQLDLSGCHLTLPLQEK